MVRHLHPAPGGHDQGVWSVVSDPDQLLDSLRCPVSLDHDPAPGDSECVLHTAAIYLLQTLSNLERPGHLVECSKVISTIF